MKKGWKVVATYFSVWHFWVQRIWPHGHFWKCSKQLPRPSLGPAQQVRSMILIGCLPSITMGLAKRTKNDWKLLFWAEFQMSFWVQRKWAIILQNVTNKHGLKCVDRMSTRSWRLHTVTGITLHRVHSDLLGVKNLVLWTGFLNNGNEETGL